MPDQSIRVFADANVLFSAVYRANAPLTRLWEFACVQIITSQYAMIEAWRNLAERTQRDRLDQLIERTELVDLGSDVPLPSDITLPQKDRPILQAAIAAQADYLVTGDRTHFGMYYESVVGGVTILPPAALLTRLR